MDAIGRSERGPEKRNRHASATASATTAIPPAAAIFTKQFRELGLTLPLIHNSGIGQKQFIDLATATAAEGVVF
ncbi:MAG: hypothetical protein Q8N53_21885, partial [Longimicrobiales bacterium]|nr:hypothetical protein [Longimicrobiales bacterium]